MIRILLLAITLLMTACASTTDKMYALENTLNAYENGIRWGDFGMAAALHQPPLDEQQVAGLSGLKDIRVSSYRALNSGIDPEGIKFFQVVEIKYYHAAYASELVMTDKQSWLFDPERQRWAITSPFPQFAEQTKSAK